MQRISEFDLRKLLTSQKYTSWLKSDSRFKDLEDGDDWDKRTARCGSHAIWVEQALGILAKEFSAFQIVTTKDVSRILSLLDAGHVLSFIHNYENEEIMFRLKKNNRYGNHEFIVLKGGDKYFVTQGFLHAYKHSLIAYTRAQIEKMFTDIIEKLCDYDDNRTWNEMELPLYKKYFRTDLFMYPKLPINPAGKVHKVVLRMDILR